MLTLDLVRVSYTADVASSAPSTFNWTHHEGDLTLIFDNFRSGGTPSEVMRVMQATMVLYEIPLQAMIEEGKKLSDMLKRNCAEVTAEQLPCSGVVRSPILALRWILSGSGLIQRIQLRFPSSEGYDQAFNHVLQLGLHMTPAKPRPSNNTGHSASTQSSVSISCPPSQLSELSNRPLTAVTLTPSSLQAQLRDAAVARPFSAQPRIPSPLKEQLYSSRPTSAASTVSVNERFDLSDATGSTRPETPMLFHRPGTIELPPRRELPFQRTDSPPNSRGSDGVRPSSRASDTLMGPPPLPPPSRDGNRRPSSMSKTNSAELSPLPKPTIIGNIHALPLKQPVLPKRAPSRKRSNATRPVSAIPAEKENQTLRSSPIPMRPSTSYGLSNNPAMNTISETRQNGRPGAFLPSPLSSDTVEQNTPSFDDNNGTENTSDSLAGYAMQSGERRTSILSTHLLQLLDDPSFLVLVEDVETNWVRIASGFV